MTGNAALQGMLRRMQDSDTGQQILRDKPRVTVSPSALQSML